MKYLGRKKKYRSKYYNLIRNWTSRALGWASTAPGRPSASRVSLHYSRVSHGIPPLLQIDLRQLHDDLKSFRMTSTDLGSIHSSMTSLHSSREWSPVSVVSLHCSRESFGCSWVTLQCSRLKLYGPRMCNSGFRMSFYGSRKSLNSYRVSLAAPGWSFTVQFWATGIQDEIPWLQGEPPCSRMSLHGSRMSFNSFRESLFCPRIDSTAPGCFAGWPLLRIDLSASGWAFLTTFGSNVSNLGQR